MASVSTYLNFPNTAEEAFTFYKTIFKTEFGGNGIMRFGDMPQDEHGGSDTKLKSLVMHVELPITGGHTLMGADAPEEMGFQISTGNNIYVNIQPDTKQETKRLFDALSQGGKIIMPLENMMWGAC